jgi:transcriptional regulator with GAF, ATPase, and Fis domain
MAQILRETNQLCGVLSRRGGAIGASPAWQGVLAAAERVATTEATVFLQGESGTGKEVVARLITRRHRGNTVCSSPSTALPCPNNCSNPLFGYERGAFTGAQQSKVGHIDLAARGVPFSMR